MHTVISCDYFWSRGLQAAKHALSCCPQGRVCIVLWRLLQHPSVGLWYKPTLSCPTLALIGRLVRLNAMLLVPNSSTSVAVNNFLLVIFVSFFDPLSYLFFPTLALLDPSFNVGPWQIWCFVLRLVVKWHEFPTLIPLVQHKLNAVRLWPMCF